MSNQERQEQALNDLQIINHRQFTWLTAALITGGGMLTVQHELVRTANMDAWFSYLLPTVYLILIAYVFGQLSSRFPQKHIFEITKTIFGPLVGNLVNLLLIFHLWLILVRDVRSMGKFVGTILLPNTPEEMVTLLILFVMLFFGRTSIEVIARVNDFFLPVLFILIVLLPLLLSNEVDSQLLQPTLATPALELLKANFLGFGWYGDIFVMAAFLHSLWNARQVTASIRHGTIIATFLLTILVFVEIIVLGPSIPGNMVYPNYSLVQHIHITDFLDRIDLPVLMVYYPVLLSKLCLIYLAFLNGIASLLKSRDYTLINSPLSLFLLLSSLLSFKSTTEIFSFGNYSSPVIFMAYQPILIAALLLFGMRYPKRSPGVQSSPEHAEGPQNKQKAGALIGKRSYQTWNRLSNVLLLLMIGAVAVGLFFGRTYSIIGMLCGFGYALCLLLMLGTTHMEIQAAKEQTVIRPHASAASRG
jgi:spore germination protein KB